LFVERIEDGDERGGRDSPGQETAFPADTMCTSPLGCANPRKRPGTMGTMSFLLLMRLKSGTCGGGGGRGVRSWWEVRNQDRREGTHLCVDERRERAVADARGAIRHGFDHGAGGEVEREVERVELGEGAA
jgi:hypothetical protein